MVILIIYLALGYWAVGQTIFKNRVFIEYKFGAVFVQRVIYGCLLGWVLIPVAVIKLIAGR